MASKKTPLPADWHLTDGLRSWARINAPGVDLDAETAAFRDYAAGHDWKMVDWNATWRNWIRKEAKKSAPKSRAHVAAPSSRPAPVEEPQGPAVPRRMALANRVLFQAVLRAQGVADDVLQRMIQAKNKVVNGWAPYPDEITDQELKEQLLKALRGAYRGAEPS